MSFNEDPLKGFEWWTFRLMMVALFLAGVFKLLREEFNNLF